jgi:hypothetical protein
MHAGSLEALRVARPEAVVSWTNEFKIRALAHKIAAKAIEQHLAQKKTDMREPA